MSKNFKEKKIEGIYYAIDSIEVPNYHSMITYKDLERLIKYLQKRKEECKESTFFVCRIHPSMEIWVRRLGDKTKKREYNKAQKSKRRSV